MPNKNPLPKLKSNHKKFVMVLILFIIFLSYIVFSRQLSKYDFISGAIANFNIKREYTYNPNQNTNAETRKALQRANIQINDNYHYAEISKFYSDNTDAKTFAICVTQHYGDYTFDTCNPRYTIDTATQSITQQYGCLIDFTTQKYIPTDPTITFERALELVYENNTKKVLSISLDPDDMKLNSAVLKYVAYNPWNNEEHDPHWSLFNTCKFKDVKLIWDFDFYLDSSPGGYSAAVDAVSGEVLYANINGDF